MLSKTAEALLLQRYAYKGESAEGVCKRVAKAISIRDDRFEKILFDYLINGIWIPNSPALRNAGRKRGMLHACFILPIEDNISSIFDTIRNMAVIFKSGGGVGLNFQSLRPKGAPLSSGGTSSGALSFMGIFNAVTETVKQGGFRRGALMGILPPSHPEIFDFCRAKLRGELTNFNLSVMVTDDFMKKATTTKGGMIDLIHEGKIYNKVRAKDIFDLIVLGSWVSGDPAMLFFDRINKDNKLYPDVVIDTTNPSLAQGTRILTDKGIFNIESLEDTQFKVPTLSGIFANARCFLSGKAKRLYEVKLKGGHKYYATAEHKWPVLWKRKYIKVATEYLRSGDYLPITAISSLGYGNIGTYDEGFLVGWNFGDGSITVRKDSGKTQYGFYFSEEDYENGIYDKVKSILHWVTDQEYELCPPKNGLYSLVSCSLKLDSLFKKFGASHKKAGLPVKVWTECTEDFRKGLIDGIVSSDGSIRGVSLTITSAYKKLVDDLADLLGFYGVKVFISYKKTNPKSPNGKIYNKRYGCYRLYFHQYSISKFNQIFKLSHTRKQDILKSIVSPHKRDLRFNNVEVVSVTPTDRYEDVWDIRVDEESHTFRLAHCVTGNCSEVGLPHYGACCLGSINISKFVEGNTFNFEKFYDVVKMGTRALLNMNTISHYPLPQITKVMQDLNPIGLGIMGFADTLIMLGIKYDSPDTLKFIDKLAEPYTKGTEEVAHDSFYKRIIAPTGSVSIIADCSSGVEPVFAQSFERHLTVGIIQETREIYKSELCRTAHQVSPEWHLNIQAKFQSIVDGGISKTINLPNNASVDDIKQIYTKAWKLGVKGVTIFREGSIDGVLIATEPKGKCSDDTCLL